MINKQVTMSLFHYKFMKYCKQIATEGKFLSFLKDLCENIWLFQ